MGGLGAEVAVRTAVERLAERGDDLIDVGDRSLRLHLGAALRLALAALTEAATERGATPRDLATTLIVLAITDNGVAAAQVGDGAIVYADAANQLTALTRPFSDEYINETTFLTSPDAVENAQFSISLGRVTRLAAFTDGLQRLALKMPSCEPHAPFFAPLFQFVGEEAEQSASQAQLDAFLRSPRITERADDDLTLFLAARIEPGMSC
jgi:hypothetical protein